MFWCRNIILDIQAKPRNLIKNTTASHTKPKIGFKKVLHLIQYMKVTLRRIYDPVKHLWVSFLQK